MADIFQLSGEPVTAANLTSRRARAFAQFAARPENEAFSLDECLAIGGHEVICVTARAPGIPQRPAYDIRYAEPLAVVFHPEGDALPDVISLRTDFPETPHRNLTIVGTPKSLCLFAEQPEDLNLRWTAALLAERILWWLHGTSYGTLHQDDQPVEALFSGIIRPLIVPPDIFDEGKSEPFLVRKVDAGPSGDILVVERQSEVPTAFSAKPFAFYGFLMPPQEHGVMHFEPRTLQDLYDLCSKRGLDLASELQSRLRQQVRQDAAGTILLLGVPMKRSSCGPVEWIQYYGFRCGQSRIPAIIRDGEMSTETMTRLLEGPDLAIDLGPAALGKTLGILDGELGMIVPVIQPNVTGNALSIVVTMLVPRVVLDRTQAALYSGHGLLANTTFLAIGQGALGSQLFANLARQGYGTWTLVDDDYFAPHNVVRHAMLGKQFGQPKAAEMARLASESFVRPPIATAIVANVLNPGTQAEAIANAARDAMVILDMSGSVGVCRYTAVDVASDARRMSAFLSPSGRDLVFMAEGSKRACRLDVIEMQYLKAVLADQRLAGHFERGEHSRYGGSCRDLTSQMSQEMVALHSAIGAKAVREAVASDKPMLVFWRCDPEKMTVARIDVPVADEILIEADQWTVILDTETRAKLSLYRAEKLPCETCGILLGTFDMLHKHIYVFSALPAPSDSVEAPNFCERGIDGLAASVQAASIATYGQAGYVGEWHSHPNGVACIPSGPDNAQMEWVKRNMHLEEKPALILIVGEESKLGVYIHEPPDTDSN